MQAAADVTTGRDTCQGCDDGKPALTRAHSPVAAAAGWRHLGSPHPGAEKLSLPVR